MGKHSIRKKKPTPPIGSTTKITTTVPEPANLVDLTNVRSEQNKAWLWLVVIPIVGLSAGLVLGVVPLDLRAFSFAKPFSSAKSSNKRVEPAKPEEWKPTTPEELLIDRFIHLRNENDLAARELLGPAAIFDNEPVSPEIAEIRQTDYFLRNGPRFVDVRRGETDANGMQQLRPGRFTLITKGSACSPHLQVRTEKGAGLSQMVIDNPDLIVEVRDGKIYALRSDAHRGP